MITSFDDYPIHQTWEPVAHPESGDPGHYDRYFFNGYSRDGGLFFALAMGLYPNRHVMDAAFSVVHGGRQHNLRASARAHVDRMRCTNIGPINLEVLEPMSRHKITITGDDHGIVGELVFTATSVPYEEPPFNVRSGNRTTMRYTRLTQIGSWEGWIELDGERHLIDPARFHGSRDRSWGIRGVGERGNVGAPGLQGPQFYWLWAPVCFEGFATVFDVNEYADGERWHQSGAMLDGPDTVRHARSVDYDITWQAGTRHMARFMLRYQFASGPVELHFEPITHFQMSGLGYLHPEWGHGMWKGELETASDSYRLPVETPLAMDHIHVQTLCNVTCSLGDGSSTSGMGVLETLVLGPHVPSGFIGYDDGAS